MASAVAPHRFFSLSLSFFTAVTLLATAVHTTKQVCRNLVNYSLLICLSSSLYSYEEIIALPIIGCRCLAVSHPTTKKDDNSTPFNISLLLRCVTAVQLFILSLPPPPPIHYCNSPSQRYTAAVSLHSDVPS